MRIDSRRARRSRDVTLLASTALAVLAATFGAGACLPAELSYGNPRQDASASPGGAGGSDASTAGPDSSGGQSAGGTLGSGGSQVGRGGTAGAGGTAGSPSDGGTTATGGNPSDSGACVDCVHAEYAAVDRDPSNSTIRAALNVRNDGPASIPLDQLVLRYYGTIESAPTVAVVPSATSIVSAASVKTYVSPNFGLGSWGGDAGTSIASAPTPFIEIGFASGSAVIPARGQTGDFELRLTSSGSAYPFDETDDYSFDAAKTTLTKTDRVILYRSGRRIWGAQVPLLGQSSCDCLVVEYQPRATGNEISFILRITNDGPEEVALSDLSARYWYTNEGVGTEVVEFDYKEPGVESVVARIGDDSARHYAEFTFPASNLLLEPGTRAGQFHVRIHPSNFSPNVQTNDHSFGAIATLSPWSRVTLYKKGQLVWGTEP